MASTTSPLKRPAQDDAAGGPPKKSKGPDQERIQKMLAEARAKATALASKHAASKSSSKDQSSTANPPPKAQSAEDRIAALRNRIASAVSRSSASASNSSRTTAPTLPRRDEPDSEEANRARGGLDVGLHPALLGDSNDASTRRKSAIQPKFATTMANRRDAGRGGKSGKKQLDITGPSADFTDPSKNPYYDPNLTVANPKRASKTLVFNQKGKYIEQANALRRQAALEAMKKRIAEAARKVGIDEDMHADKAFAIEPPPDIEWWDTGLTSTSCYTDISSSSLLINTPDSIITHYIQHPIQLDPPQEKHLPPPKPLPLTKKEQKKIRRQRRASALKEKQAKVRLGLEPPPPPKVKKSNLMRVLGEEAVKDPTAVEARVNREIQERLDVHLQANQDRKLTKEQRHEKLAANQEKDLQLGIHCLVFRIENLANGRHRYKININAEQLALTGICILNPKFNLVIVEGGAHSIKIYRKLMLQRIDWKESLAPNPEIREGNNDAAAAAASSSSSSLVAGTSAGATDGGGGAHDTSMDGDVDMSRNACTLVWEGELKAKGFKKFSSERCPSDAMAKDRLSRAKMENMWIQAKNAVTKEG